MEAGSKIYVAGHNGLVGSAVLRKLEEAGYKDTVVVSHKDLDLTRQEDVERFFKKEKPDHVFLAAGRVGGILANSTYGADFIYENIMIASNVIHSSYKYGVKKLLNLGSSCIYPRSAPQPLKEDYLLTGRLESTNEPYAIAKISAIKLCRYYNDQYGTNFMSVMPANQYGPNDNYDLKTSHVLPALIRKFHLAKLLQTGNLKGIIKDFDVHENSSGFKNTMIDDIETFLEKFGISRKFVRLWGSGTPYREFLHVDDTAEACVFLMRNYEAKDIGEFVNIGSGKDIQIRELADIIKQVVGYKGMIEWDASKPDGTPRKFLNVEKINKLGWEAKIKLKTGINNVYNAYLN